MNRFERVIQILDDAIGGPDKNIRAHRAFWRGLTRDEFVAKIIFGREVVTVGQGAASNLVKALKGEAPFGSDLPTPPPGAEMRRMPAGLPAVADEDIAFIAQWIDDGCPEEAEPPAELTWRPTPAPDASSRHDDIWFLTPELGWAVNSDGHILKTADGGKTWEVQFRADVYLRCIGFASELRGWVGTLGAPAAKRLFETRDGGTTWQPVADLPVLAPSWVCGLSVVNASVAYASGTNEPFPTFNRPPRMMKTVDGGESWTAWDMTPHASLLVDTYFTSPDRGWVVGGQIQPGVPIEGDDEWAKRGNVKPVVLFTEDGGQTWVDRVADIKDEFPLGEWGWKIQFISDQVGFVALENGFAAAILKTTDGGESWKRLEVKDPQGNANLEGVGFVDENHGWVGGWGSADFEQGSTSETKDGGVTWTDANEIGRFINRFRFFGNPVTVGYASGLTVYKYSSEPLPAPQALAPIMTPRLLESKEPTDSSRPVRLPITVPEGASRLAVNIWGRFGAHVRHLLDEAQPEAGSRTIEWDVTNDDGESLPLGSFIIRVTVDEESESRIVHVRT